MDLDSSSDFFINEDPAEYQEELEEQNYYVQDNCSGFHMRLDGKHLEQRNR